MGMDLGQKHAIPGRAQPHINVTPLVDVVLVLLIIFMVIAPLLAKQFWLSLPNKPDKEQPQEPADNQPVVILATKTGAIMINRETVSRSDLSMKLQRILAARQQRTVFFDAEDDTAFGDAVDVLDLARAGGAATVAVLTAPVPTR